MISRSLDRIIDFVQQARRQASGCNRTGKHSNLMPSRAVVWFERSTGFHVL